MRLTIPERRLRRYAERFDIPQIELRGRRVHVRLAVGSALAGEASGERQFGGAVWFDVEASTLEARMVVALGGLCECAKSPGDCDCCPACEANGHVAQQVCARCAGLGYVSTDL